MTNVKYGKLTGGLIGAWFTFSLLASALNVFRNDSVRPPLALGLAFLIPVLAFALWFATSAGFRQFTLSLNPRTLTLVQAWRIVGFVFLVLQTYAILPGLFALPAGWGDITIGATAILVATNFVNPDHRKGFIVWQFLGISDLVVAMTIASVAGLISPNGIPMAPGTVLPLSLIPTFGVPLFFILHIICIAQARRWPTQKHLHVEGNLATSHA